MKITEKEKDEMKKRKREREREKTKSIKHSVTHPRAYRLLPHKIKRRESKSKVHDIE
jgi:hypothetical protein